MAPSFTTNLDPDTEERLDALVRAAGEQLGRLPSWRGRRLPDRTDVLRAMVALANRDADFRAAVIAQVRADRMERYGTPEDNTMISPTPPAGPGGLPAEVAAVAADLERQAAGLSSPDHQSWMSTVASDLRHIAGDIGDVEPDAIAERLGGDAWAIERTAAAAGGYEGLRPMLELATRLRQVQDTVFPTQKITFLAATGRYGP